MRKFLRDNGLSLALLALFLVSFVGQVFSGLATDNHERLTHGQSIVTLGQYLSDPQLISAVFENWESEFLQMWAFVMLTAYLFQRGSPESKDPDRPAPQDRDPALDAKKPDAPWAVRAGGVIRALYGHSLGLAMLLLFLVSFVLHWVFSTRHAAQEALLHHLAPPGLVQHLFSGEFWFESFQNWQSEFLSTGVLVVLAIFLRERGSPESKPVAAGHGETGTG